MSSLSYASRLTQGVDYGECGLAEKEDTARVRVREMDKLEKLFRNALYVVMHTGAGVSTSCGIRDFRGPNGVWTREKRGLGFDLLPGDVPFEEASPSLTHMAILGLALAGRCRFVVSQNVDGLHLRSGLPNVLLAELHGNIFQERCQSCKRVYFRNFDVGGCGFRETPRQCDAPCGGRLVDMVLDWQDALPPRQLELAQRHSLLADLSVALGTSFRVQPAAGIPLMTVHKGAAVRKQRRRSQAGDDVSGDGDDDGDDDDGDDNAEPLPPLTDAERKMTAVDGALAIINLQATPHDREAHVRVHGKCDRVMRELVRRLGVAIPDFVRRETYSLRVSSDGVVRVATDEFDQNCLFARELRVELCDAATGARLHAAVVSPRQPYTLPVADAVAVGRRVRLAVVVALNDNATLDVVQLETSFGWGAAAEHRVEVEVVRRVYPVGEADDGAWLERDLPRPEPRKRGERQTGAAAAAAAVSSAPVPPAPASGKRRRKDAAAGDQGKDDDGNGPVVRLVATGAVDPGLQCAWPIGFHSQVEFASLTEAGRTALYSCEVLCRNAQPVFRVICHDGDAAAALAGGRRVAFEGDSPDAVWSAVVQQLPQPPAAPVSGMRMFGLMPPK